MENENNTNNTNNIENSNSSSSTNVKMVLVILSLVVAVISAFRGYVLTTVGGLAIGLTSLTPFYIYTTTTLIAIYLSKEKHNIIANIMIILSLLTYGWTYWFVQQVVKNVTKVQVIIHPFFYIYLSSALFLVIALFINEKKEKVVKEGPNKNIQELSSGLENNINKDNFIFANIVLGLKEIPYGTESLLVNNTYDNTLDIIYVIDNNNQTIKTPITDIKSISFKVGMKVQNTSQKVESNETKSALLSAVVFGGNPLLQLAGNTAFNNAFDGLSNNYDKVNYNSCYDITVELVINGEEVRFIFSTPVNPNKFIDLINEKLNTK